MIKSIAWQQIFPFTSAKRHCVEAKEIVYFRASEVRQGDTQ